MYVPDHFAITDEAQVHALMAAHPLAALVTTGEGGLEATHLPLLLDSSRGKQGVLQGHFARANTHWKRVGAETDALAIFTGADAYITPSWYPTKQETGKVVPTWNYSAVHVTGRLTIHDDVDWLEGFLRHLTDIHEAELPEPWSIDDAPDGYIRTIARGVVGIELEISRIDAKAKLSQNRSTPDHDGVARGLQARGLNAVAAAVSKTR